MKSQAKSRKMYWWLVTHDETGKRYLVFGSAVSEEDARQRGFEILGGVDFDIKQYPTSDISAASQMLRGKRLEQTHSLTEAGKRIGHGKSLKRLHKKRNVSEGL